MMTPQQPDGYGTYDSLYIKSKQINKTNGFITYITNSFKWIKRKGLKELSFCHKLEDLKYFKQ